MNIHLSCIPCLFKQVIQAGELAKIPRSQIKHIMDLFGDELKYCSMDESSPSMGKKIQELIVESIGVEDPYITVKKISNEKALSAYPFMKQTILESDNRLLKAVQLACAGNIIDYGVFSDRNLDISKEIEKILEMEQQSLACEGPELFDFTSFSRSLESAETIMYVGDNCGEIVFDRALIETIAELYPNKNIYFIVRGKPILNDCLEQDAYDCGIDLSAEIMSSGAASPGLLLAEAAPECVELFKRADMIISKGQGNYEGLSGEKGPIYFLLVAKCDAIAEDIGCSVGDLVLKQV